MVLGPLGDAARSAYDGVTGTVASVFGSDPSGNAGGSSVWEAWGHPELYSMVRDTVSPGDIQEGASAYRQVGTRIRDSFDGFTRDLDGIVQGGWRGQSAEAATAALAPLRDWSGQLSAVVGQTGELMGSSGESAEQTRRDVPEPVDFNVAQTLRSAGSGLLGGGPAGALLGGGVDAVAQERAQDEARAEAVRVMNTSYSPPLLEGRDSVPEYPRPINPTTVAPEASPIGGPSPDPGSPGGQGSSSGGSTGGAGGGSTGGGSTGAQLHQPYQQPGGAVSSPAASQPAPVGTGGQAVPGGLGGSQQPGGGPAGAGGTVSPGMAPVAGGFGGTGGDQARPGGRYGGAGGAGRATRGSGSRGSGSAGGGFGPRGSGGGGSAAGGAGGSGQRPSWSSGGAGGQGPGGAVAAAGRAGSGAGRGGGMPFGAMGAGRGPGGEDSEHQRKILIEADRDAIVGQLDAVAPPVIGEDPDVYQRDDNR